jgi:hypothetical protein
MDVTTAFSIGDTLFVKKSAEMGALEEVVIKDIKIFQNSTVINILYEDTFNRQHLEHLLITQSEAVILAKAFFQDQIDSINDFECP